MPWLPLLQPLESQLKVEILEETSHQGPDFWRCPALYPWCTGTGLLLAPGVTELQADLHQGKWELQPQALTETQPMLGTTAAPTALRCPLLPIQ